jgi:S-adenosylmethionine-diacylgycerolhomoserine-N-methlytransferase
MLETAAKAVAKAGLTGQIALAHGYAEALSPELFGAKVPFDEIVFSYSLSMIPDWKQALQAASASLAQQGRIHIVDFGDLRGMIGPARKALLGWLALFHVEPRVELLKVLENIARQDVDLRVLPGRYAFLLSGPGDRFAALGSAVAPQSQGADKTRIAGA